MENQATRPSAILYRMVSNRHICPWGLKARHLLRRQGFAVDDHWLTTREETDAFKAEHGVKTTPQCSSAASGSAAMTMAGWMLAMHMEIA